LSGTWTWLACLAHLVIGVADRMLCEAVSPDLPVHAWRRGVDARRAVTHVAVLRAHARKIGGADSGPIYTRFFDRVT
jgi:hypothetical protein